MCRTHPYRADCFLARPDARGFESHFRARVKNSARCSSSAPTGTVRFRVIGESPTCARRDIQPAEERLRQRQLMIRVRAAPLHNSAARRRWNWSPETAGDNIPPNFRSHNKPASRQLLLKTGEPHIRQPLHRFEKIIHTRLREHIQAEIPPQFVRLHERVRLRVLPIIALKEIAHHSRRRSGTAPARAIPHSCKGSPGRKNSAAGDFETPARSRISCSGRRRACNNSCSAPSPQRPRL